MGHQRLGDIPKSQRWTTVVAAVAGAGGTGVAPSSVAEIARLTLDAAAQGLERAKNDPGLQYTFYLLTQLVLVAREPDWRDRLARHGITLQEDSSLFDLTAGLQQVVEDRVLSSGAASDVGEIAQQAACEAVATLTGPNARTLFGQGSAELQDAVRQLSTKAGFRRLGQHFFGRFMARFLNFYLSRVTAGHGSGPLAGVAELSQFNDGLSTHCYQSARIVRDFCGEWYSKTEFQEGISPENTSRFMAVALDKLQAELEKQRESDD